MAKTIEEHVKIVIKALKQHNQYSNALNAQVIALASAMRNLEMANEQIDTLSEVTVWEETRYGKKIAPHPAFKIAKDAQESITRNMKTLKLTVEDLSGEIDDDPLVNLTKKLEEKRKHPKVLRK